MTVTTAHLTALDRQLASCRSGPLRARLLAVSARAALLAGRLALFDLADRPRARSLHTLVSELAAESGDVGLSAAAYAHLGYLAALEGRPVAAHRYLRWAADGGSSARVRAWVMAVGAETEAMLGRTQAAWDDLEQAEEVLPRASGSGPDWLDFFDGARLAGFRGSLALDCGQLDGADTFLTAARSGLAPAATKQRAVYLSDLALVRCGQGRPEEASVLGHQAATLLTGSPYATAFRRLEHVASRLSLFTHRPVQDLGHALRDRSGPDR